MCNWVATQCSHCTLWCHNLHDCCICARRLHDHLCNACSLPELHLIAAGLRISTAACQPHAYNTQALSSLLVQRLALVYQPRVSMGHSNNHRSSHLRHRRWCIQVLAQGRCLAGSTSIQAGTRYPCHNRLGRRHICWLGNTQTHLVEGFADRCLLLGFAICCHVLSHPFHRQRNFSRDSYTCHHQSIPAQEQKLCSCTNLWTHNQSMSVCVPHCSNQEYQPRVSPLLLSLSSPSDMDPLTRHPHT